MSARDNFPFGLGSALRIRSLRERAFDWSTVLYGLRLGDGALAAA
jgi:hypothetical protein